MDGRVALYHSDIFIRDNLGTSEQLKDLYDQIQEAKTSNKEEISRSNDGCFRTTKKYKNDDWLMAAVQDMTKKAAEYYFETDESFLQHVPDKKIKINYWTNVNQPGASNVIHNHEKDSFAAVFYLQAEGTGDISFVNPANLLSNCNPASPFTRCLNFSPEDNQLILWPAWVPHEVYPNPSDKERINIVFSIQLT